MDLTRSVRLLFPLVLAPVMLTAQVTIRGGVADSVTHEALVGANVYIPGTALGGVTDREGKFVIYRVPAGSRALRASYIGYRSRDVAVEIGTVDLTVNFGLVPDVIQGAEVLVTAQM